MTVTVNGVQIAVSQGITIVVDVDPAGETLPQVDIIVNNGRLDVYKSRVATTGDISLHMLGGDQP